MIEEIPMKSQETEVIKEQTEKVLREDYAYEWWLIKPTKDKGAYPFGSKNFSKMMAFLIKAKPTMEDLNYWTNRDNFPVYRKENEEYDFYWLRRRFVQHLEKYRLQIIGIIYMMNIENISKIQKEEKIKQISFKDKEQEI